MSEALLDGVPVDIGGLVFLVPPLTLGAFKRTKADRAVLSGKTASEDDMAECAVRVIHATLLRNYPSLTLTELEELVTFANMGRVLQQVVSAWGSDDSAGKAAAGNPQT